MHDNPTADADVIVNVLFHERRIERLGLGQRRPFGRRDLHPPDRTISAVIGEVRVIAEGALIVSYPSANTKLWLAGPAGRGPEISSQYPLLVRDEAVVMVGAHSDLHIGHRFQIGVSVSDWDLSNAAVGEPSPTTRAPADLSLTARQRDSLAALTVDYPTVLASRPLIRSTRQAAMPHRPDPLDHAQIQDAVNEVTTKLVQLGWMVPRAGKPQQSTCDWVVDHGVIGPPDWDRVRGWLRDRP